MEKTDPRVEIKREMDSLEKDAKRYQKPDVMLGLKASVLDEVWDVFSFAPIKTEAAPFILGRIFQALEPYRTALYAVKRYEELQGKLVKADTMVKAAQAAQAG